MRLRHLSDPDSLPALDKSFAIERPALGLAPDAPPVRILLLYGSLRARSFSRLAVEEAARLLQFFGAEHASSTRPICRCPIKCKATITRPSRSCAPCPSGQRDKSGAARNATVRLPVS